MVRKKISIHDARKMTNKSVNSLIHFTREQNFCPIYYVVGIKKKPIHGYCSADCISIAFAIKIDQSKS